MKQRTINKKTLFGRRIVKNKTRCVLAFLYRPCFVYGFLFLSLLFSTLLLSAFVSSQKAEAFVTKLGLAQSSTTGGRIIPALYGGVDVSNLGFSLSSVGHKETLSYFSAWQLNGFLLWKNGKLFWGTIEAGVGWGAFIYEIGFKGNLAHSGVTKTGFATGPAIRVFWHFTKFMFTGIESMYGIRGYQALFLSAQDSASLIIGFEF
jgi:hypothetical protein